jgi:hypothetical protein
MYHHKRRLDRAQYHLTNLQSEIDAWVDEGPLQTWIQTEADDENPKKYLYCQVLRKPPSHLSLIIGDCLHNLRSALDNLAFELALEHTQGPMSKEIEEASAFPIQHLQTKKSNKRFKDMTEGIDPKAKQAIADLQPYNRGAKFASDSLWQLNELSRRDKHRLPPVASLVTIRSLTYFVPEGIETAEVNMMVTGFEGRAPVVNYPALDKTGAKVKDIDFNLIFSVGFSYLVPKNLLGRQIPEVLENIYTHITDRVLPPLQSFLHRQ